jgi:hypothetical protein
MDATEYPKLRVNVETVMWGSKVSVRLHQAAHTHKHRHVRVACTSRRFLVKTKTTSSPPARCREAGEGLASCSARSELASCSLWQRPTNDDPGEHHGIGIRSTHGLNRSGESSSVEGV